MLRTIKIGFMLLMLGMYVAAGDVSMVQAQGEGPPDSTQRVTGPAIDAVMTSTYDNGTVTSVIVGSCKKQSIVLYGTFNAVSPNDFSSQNASTIENRHLGPALQLCFPGSSGTMIITGVSKFNNTGVDSTGKGALGADISISSLEPK